MAGEALLGADMRTLWTLAAAALLLTTRAPHVRADAYEEEWLDEAAARQKLANERQLQRLLGWLAPGSDAAAAICAPPFPPHARAPVRWFHVPRCGTTFFNTILRHACPDDPRAWDVTIGEVRTLKREPSSSAEPHSGDPLSSTKKRNRGPCETTINNRRRSNAARFKSRVA